MQTERKSPFGAEGVGGRVEEGAAGIEKSLGEKVCGDRVQTQVEACFLHPLAL